MGNTAVSTLDLVDEFLLLRPDEDFSTVPGRSIHEFGEKVREYSRTSKPRLAPDKHPVYIGGWPSANFWLVHGDLILSSLLYSGQVLVRDPIADWFADEQYQIEHLISYRGGYLDPMDGYKVSMARTRAFLIAVVPALNALRPLINAGILVLVPAERTYLEHSTAINALKQQLMEKVASDPLHYSERFSPSDIAVEASVRGLFAFAGGDATPQIARAIEHGLRYFSREYLLAAQYGATYTAAFDHELFLCREGINRVAGPASTVSQAILQSDLPVFSGLSPRLIKDIHDDDAFEEFRRDLHLLYQGAPLNSSSAELQAYVHDQEQAVLMPTLKKAEKSAASGLLSRLGASLSGSRFGLATGLASDLVLQTGGLATVLNGIRTVAETAFQNRPTGSTRIWTSLVKHQKQATDEMVYAETTTGSARRGWGIPAEPGLNVYTSPGAMLWEHGPLNGKAVADAAAGPDVYGPCGCGSGRKLKFCCEGLHKYRPQFMRQPPYLTHLSR